MPYSLLDLVQQPDLLEYLVGILQRKGGCTLVKRSEMYIGIVWEIHLSNVPNHKSVSSIFILH